MTARIAALTFGAGLLTLLTAADAQAGRVRYHYVPADDCGHVTLQPCGGAPGERLTWTARWEPYNCPPPRATCLATFRHLCTGRTVIVPLALSLDIPRMEYRTNRVIYNYGSETIEVVFLPDGGVDVVYNSGLLRAP